MNEYQQKEVDSSLPMYRGTMSKAFDGQASPRGAIKAMCLHCTGYERKVIVHCTSYGCPLWLYRPFQASKKDETTAEPAEIAV